jgi:hypothetical protein
MTRSMTLLLAILLVSTGGKALPAQALVLGGGLNAGTIPRALEPLCGSARRLRGIGVAARAGVAASRFQVDATLDYVSRVGVRDIAGCVPRSGMSVDSSFAPAGNSAETLGVTGSIPLNRALRTGVEIGWVHGRSSWFVGPVLAAQIRNIRIEVAARRHVVTYDEITREYGSGTTREISRRSLSERSWGAMGRMLLLVRP